MTSRRLLSATLLIVCGCFKLDTTNIGDSDSLPLVRVDGVALPASISDSLGSAAQVSAGQLTVYTTRASCDYVVDLSTGKQISGETSCLAGSVTAITGGVELHIDLATVGSPRGVHAYDFVAVNKPCMCPKFCLCGAQRSIPDSVRKLVGALDTAARGKGNR